MNDKALIKFQIGPVQPFIEAAKTTRDLWTGSYLLPWLVVAAMEGISKNAEIVSPDIADNPILHRQRFLKDRRVLTPCLPNHFEAWIPDERRDEIARECEQACRAEWWKLAEAVRNRLKQEFPQLDKEPDWDRDWERQIESYFEMRCVVLPASEIGSEDGIQRLHALMDAARFVKHTPNYVPKPDAKGRFGMKCSVLGIFEQMGPADLYESRKFWDALAKEEGFDGTKIRTRDRFCAVSLVKRFAWPAYLADELGFGNDKKALRYHDTATVAAREWLKSNGIDPEKEFKTNGWSGQWLHPNDRQEDDEKCEDDDLRERISKAREKKKPPAYYAVLMLDGDNVGGLFIAEGKDSQFSAGVPITKRLSRFALNTVRPIVEGHSGELIYAGGDDVLAVSPTASALACALSLYKNYCSAEVMGRFEEATMSAGIVIAHYKEDLRFVLEETRKAERAAKKSGRNQVVLRVLRRSGEHTSVPLRWDIIPDFQRLVGMYIGSEKSRPPSDRWAYKLRAGLPVVQGSLKMFQSEMKRLLGKLELPEDLRNEFPDFVMRMFDAFGKSRERRDNLPPCSSPPEDRLIQDFVIACQSASFLARGRDE